MTTSREDFFAKTKQFEFSWQGQPAKLPVFYYDNTSITAIYTARTDRVQALLPQAALRPIELYPGRSLVAFTAFEYRESDIDPYNELSISLMATLGRRPIPGVTVLGQLARRCFSAYVWQLPVTTEKARVGGVELYGYPKFLADITFEREPDWLSCQLSVGGQRILGLRGRSLSTSRGALTRYVTYSFKDGIPLVANVLTDPLEYGENRTGRGVEVRSVPRSPNRRAAPGAGSQPAPLALPARAAHPSDPVRAA